MGVAERRERERGERRECIIDAAERVFLARGLDAATMDEIADAAELSKGALYLHFKSKGELYVEVLSRFSHEMVGKLPDIAAAAPTGIAAVEAIARAHVEFGTTYPERFRLAMSWMLARETIDRDNESFVRHGQRIVQAMRAHIGAVERGQRDGTIRTDVDASALARQLWASTVGVVLVDVSHSGDNMPHLRGAPRFESVAPGFIGLIMDAIKPQPRGAIR